MPKVKKTTERPPESPDSPTTSKSPTIPKPPEVSVPPPSSPETPVRMTPLELEELSEELSKELQIHLTPPQYQREVRNYVEQQGPSINRLIYLSFEGALLPNPTEVVARIAEHIQIDVGVWGRAADRVCANLLALQPALSPEVLARKAVTAMAVGSLMLLPADLYSRGGYHGPQPETPHAPLHGSG